MDCKIKAQLIEFEPKEVRNLNHVVYKSEKQHETRN